MAFISPASYVVLAVQVAILVAMVGGAYLMRTRRLMRPHGLAMATLAVINLVTVAVLMVPTFFDVAASPRDVPGAVLLAHHLVGLAAVALTVVVAFSWLLRGARSKGCLGVGRRGKLIMRTTFTVWATSILLGMAVFLLYL